MDLEASSALSRLLGDVPWTLPALLWRRAQFSVEAPARWSLADNAVWTATTWGQYRDESARIAQVLSGLGLMPGQRVGIMAPSSAPWDAVQMAILTARGVVVGLDPHDREDSLNSIAECSGLSGLIIAESRLLERFNQEVRERLNFVISLGPSDHPDVQTLESLLGAVPVPSIELPMTQPEDPATIIFTSGTTGTPKGIQYSHRQVLLAIAAILDAFPGIGAADRLACWLPLSNLFQRIVNGCAIATGAQTYYVEDPRAIMSHIGTIAPHLFIGVPRFYEKLYAGLMARIESGPAWQRALVAWALRQGDRQAIAQRAGHRLNLPHRLSYALADRLVLHRLRGVMGGHLRFLVSGSAPMPIWLLERFHAMGLLVLEAYGMSENIIPVAMNRPDVYRFGTVGKVLMGNQVRLADDGELWVRGAGVFDGYLGDDGAGDRFDDQGYLASGDFAALDSDGFITLTGRKSEIFKTSTGRRIAPAGIEAVLRQLPYVEQAIVFGASRPFVVAVLVVAEAAWRARTGGHPEPAQQCACLRQDLAPGLATLADYQRPVGVVVSTRALSIERGELTANLKLRRAQVEAAFREPIEALYERLGDRRQSEARMLSIGDDSILLCSLILA